MGIIKTFIRQEEKITELDHENKELYEENKALRYENEELELFKNNIKRIMQEANKKHENYFVTFEKIEKELAVGQTY